MLDFIFTKTHLRYLVESLWRDEAFAVLLARKDIGEILVNTARDFSPPLYYLVLKIWMAFFGSSEVAVRSLSMIFYCGAFYIFYLLLKDVFKIKGLKVLLYLFLFFINPLILYYAFEARMYMMFTFFAAASYYFFFTQKRGAYIATTTLGLLSHYFMVFAIGTQLLMLVILHRKKTDVKKWIFYMVISFLIFTPWFLYAYLSHLGSAGDFWILKPVFKDILHVPVYIYNGYEKDFRFYGKYLNQLSLLITAILAGGVFYALRKNNAHDRHLYFSVFLWVVVPVIATFIFSFFTPIFLPRYLIFAGFGLILLIVLSLDKMPAVIRIAFLVALVLFTTHYNKLFIKERRRPDFRPVMREIKSQIGKDDLLYVNSELNYHPALYYFEDESRVYVYRKTYFEIPTYVGRVLIPPGKIKKNLPIFPKKAFILKQNLSYEIQSAD